MFKIGKLAKNTNCQVETIRFYENIGLMPNPDRTERGHRVYGSEHEKRLRFIRRSRELDFTLEEIRALLEFLDTKNYSCDQVHSFADGHIRKIKSKIAELKEMENSLVRFANQCEENKDTNCPLLDQLFNED